MKEIIESLFQMIIALVKAVYEIIPFTSPYGIIKYIAEQGTISGIAWIDKTLFLIAGLIPAAITALIATKFKLNWRMNCIICIILYLAVLELFASIVFWCVLGGMLILIVILWIISSRQQFE